LIPYSGISDTEQSKGVLEILMAIVNPNSRIWGKR